MSQAREKGEKEEKGENVCTFLIVVLLREAVVPQEVGGGRRVLGKKDALEQGLSFDTSLFKFRRAVPKL